MKSPIVLAIAAVAALTAGSALANPLSAMSRNLTSRVVDWNPANEMISFADGTQKILPRDLVPAGLHTGDGVSIVFESRSVEGMDRIREIKVLDTEYVDQVSENNRYTPF